MVSAPASWLVLANSAHASAVEADGLFAEQDARFTNLSPAGLKLWTFEQSAVFSTYLVCLVAGELDTYTDVYDNRIPLSVPD